MYLVMLLPNEKYDDCQKTWVLSLSVMGHPILVGRKILISKQTKLFVNSRQAT